MKIVQNTIKSNNDVFPKIKNSSVIKDKMEKIKNEELKSSLNSFLKAYNEKNK